MNVWRLSALDAAERSRIVRRSEAEIEDVSAAAQAIIDDVRERGDVALIDYARKFDRADVSAGLKATDEEFERAYATLEPAVLEAIRTAVDNVSEHHRQQRARVEPIWLDPVRPGVYAGEKITPIESVGLYVPRGKGAFPSVMYMLCAPAAIAGVKSIVVCSPPTPEGGLDAASLVAADLCGVRDLYKVGGAQAIAALAFGTETVPKVMKVSGPGNPFVAAAKRLLSNVIDPGMPAGPSEAIVLADDGADPRNTALDLLNEAEHGPDSASLLVTDSEAFATEVRAIATEMIAALPDERRRYCEASFAKYGGVMICDDLDQAIAFCNDYAVEHLLVKVRDPGAAVAKLTNVGEILIGEHTAISLANYAVGINAVLPTGRHALTHDCTSVWTFLKRTSLSFATKTGFEELRGAAATLADFEGFPAHARALRDRNPAVEQSISLADLLPPRRGADGGADE